MAEKVVEDEDRQWRIAAQMTAYLLGQLAGLGGKKKRYDPTKLIPKRKTKVKRKSESVAQAELSELKREFGVT